MTYGGANTYVASQIGTFSMSCENADINIKAKTGSNSNF